MTAVQNLGLAVSPYAIGGVLTTTNNDYLLVELIYAVCAAVAAAFTAILIVWDIRNGRKLNTFNLKKNAAEITPVADEQKPLLVNN